MPYAFKVGILAFDATRLCAADVDFPMDVLLYQKGSFEMIEHRYERDKRALECRSHELRLLCIGPAPGRRLFQRDAPAPVYLSMRTTVRTRAGQPHPAPAASHKQSIPALANPRYGNMTGFSSRDRACCQVIRRCFGAWDRLGDNLTNK